MIRAVLQMLFWLALGVWTVLLVRPTTTFQPVSDELASWSDLLPFLVSKGLHLSVYAGFAVGTLVLFRRKKWLFAVVTCHAVLGEVGQFLGNLWFVTGRVGSVKDVLIDWTGMALGCGIWWLTRRVAAARVGSRTRHGGHFPDPRGMAESP